MEQRDDKWKELLQEQFAHFEADTERDLWPEIEGKIDTRRVPFYLWRSTWLVAASLILLLGMIWVLRNTEGDQPQAPMANVPEQVQPQQPADTSNPLEDHELTYAGGDMLPSAPSPSVIAQLEQAKREEAGQVTQSSGREDDERTDSPLPPSRVIRQVGAMQPVLPESLQEQLNQAQERPTIAATRPKATTPAAKIAPTQGDKQSLDLNNLTLGDAVNFASNELGKLVKTPLEVYKEETDGQEVRTYQLDLFNLRITRKTHKQTTKS